MSADVTAKIRAKGLNATGVTEDLARKLYENPGMHLMAIVELSVAERHESTSDGARRIDLILDTVEPVVDGKLNGTIDEHVRGIQQSLYQNRARANGDVPLPIDEDDEPTPIGDVIAQGAGLFEDDDDEEDDEDQDDSGLSVDPDSEIPGTVESGGGGEWTNEQTGEVTPAGQPLPDIPDDAYPDDAEPIEETAGPWPGDPDFSARKTTSVT